jgi:hypothetical protein
MKLQLKTKEQLKRECFRLNLTTCKWKNKDFYLNLLMNRWNRGMRWNPVF